MLTSDFPTHIHYVPPQHGVLLFRGLQMLQDHANKLYNQGMANNDKAMIQGATILLVEIQDCITRQFDNYTVDHLNKSVFVIPKKSTS